MDASLAAAQRPEYQDDSARNDSSSGGSMQPSPTSGYLQGRHLVQQRAHNMQHREQQQHLQHQVQPSTLHQADGRAKKKFQRTTSENEDPLRKSTSSLPFSTRQNHTQSRTEQKVPQHVRRRSTLNKAPLLGPRPFQNNRVTSESNVAAYRPSYLPTSMSEQSIGQSVGNGSNIKLSFSHPRQSTTEQRLENQDVHVRHASNNDEFLPSVNFDDFHASITQPAPYHPDLSSFPAPRSMGKLDSTSGSGRRDLPGPERGTESLSSLATADESFGQRDSATNRGSTTGLRTRVPPETSKVSESMSLARQFSSARRPAKSSTDSTAMPPPNAPLYSRGRRQSTLPTPPSPAPAAVARPPRKSMAPGQGYQGSEQRRAVRESPVAIVPLTRTVSTTKGKVREIPASSSNAQSDSRQFMSRNFRTNSLQPPPRKEPQSVPSTHPNTPTNGTTHSGSGVSSGRSQAYRTQTPTYGGNSSSKRQSTIQQHVSGLGARTISPTDARRLKRMSIVPTHPPVPQAPLTPQPDSVPNFLDSTNSPAVPQQPTNLTPSSARVSPDLTSKSFDTGLSVSHSSSFSSLRQANGGSTSRNSQLPSSSRLPAPKMGNVHSPAGMAGEEVPPVPAIPKAYESPKEHNGNDQSQSYFGTRRPQRVDPDDMAVSGTSRTQAGSRAQTGSILASARSSVEIARPDLSQDRKVLQTTNARHRRGLTTSNDQETETERGRGSHLNKKNLQPLRLPPLNLLPLSTPTAARVASFANISSEARERQGTPPPTRNDMKTPSTPMTASKATFFSRSERDTEDGFKAFNLRSASSHHIMHDGFGARGLGPSPVTPLPITSPTTRQAPTPFSSNSLPKSTDGFGNLYAKPLDNYSYEHQMSAEPASVSFPSPRPAIAPRREVTSTRTSISNDEPSTPASSTSLRRKLSLSWKRSSSKASQRAKAENERQERAERAEMMERNKVEAKNTQKHNEMPPPRLPASATWTVSPKHGESASRPSLDTRLRKPSHNNSSSTSLDAEMSLFMGNLDAKVEGSIPPPHVDAHRVTSRSSSHSLLNPMQRMLGAKNSLGTLKARHLDTNLDKDDLAADKIMEKMGSRRKDFEQAARELDDLRRRAQPKERVSPGQAIQTVNLNIFERGEVIDYKEIYFCGTRNAKKHVGDLDHSTNNFGYDDDRGDYNIVFGDHLAYRYEVVDMLGKGSFGQVVRCIDHKSGVLVAVKIIRNKKRFHQQALVEVNILQKLREWDPENKHSMINFTQSFYFRGHLCISTELLGMNLYEFIKAYEFKGFPLPLIRRFTKQILASLILLKSKRVIHCDLKPENILLAHPMHSEIKVIDFGSSCFENEKVYTYIQSRFYRSPEVILGMSYGIPIDMWSVGCILAELLTGYPIFPGENEQEQLACIMEIFGPPEKHLIEKSSRKKLFFDSMGKPRVTISSKGRRRRASSKTLQQTLKCDDDFFLDFIARCLRWDPERRLKPEEALRHEFLTGIKRPPANGRSRAVQVTGPTLAQSPIKRFNTAKATPKRNIVEGVRPLPEPPLTSFRQVSAVPTPSSSPIKAIHPGAGRRHSTFTAGQTNLKRGSSSGVAGPTGAPGSLGSGLPRAAPATVVGRSVSGKPDMAYAAAAASLVGS